MARYLSPSDIEKFRDRLCDVAAQLLSEAGREGFNMRELAARLGVSAMTTYRYFKDKDEILAALRERAFSRFADRIEVAGASPGAAEDRIYALSQAYAEFVQEEQFHYRLMFDLSQPKNRQQSASRPEEARARAILTKQMCVLVDEGILHGDPDSVGQILWCAMHGVSAHHLTGALRDGEYESVLAESMRAFVSAYRGSGNGDGKRAVSERQFASSSAGRIATNGSPSPISLLPAE
jgi:AcrR family transcriptional regulator